MTNSPFKTKTPTPEEVDAYIAEGQRLRAEALRSFGRSVWRGLVGSLSASAKSAPRDPAATQA